MNEVIEHKQIDLAEAARVAQVSVDEIIERMKASPGGTLVAKLQITRKATGKVENWTLVCKG